MKYKYNKKNNIEKKSYKVFLIKLNTDIALCYAILFTLRR